MEAVRGLMNTNATAARKPATAAANGQALEDRRKARLQDLLAEAQDDPDTLRSNLRAATAELLDTGRGLAALVKVRLETPTAPMGSHQETLALINTLTVVHRQATRYVQEVRLRDSEQGAQRVFNSARP
jgi:hypothetical protein